MRLQRGHGASPRRLLWRQDLLSQQYCTQCHAHFAFCELNCAFKASRHFKSLHTRLHLHPSSRRAWQRAELSARREPVRPRMYGCSACVSYLLLNMNMYCMRCTTSQAMCFDCNWESMSELCNAAQT